MKKLHCSLDFMLLW